MKTLRLILVCLIVMLPAGELSAAHSGTSVVLVASSGSSRPDTFSVSELRRLFLGIPVRRGGEMVTPLINASDKDIYQAFLQKVMFMSEANYQRQLVLRVFRRGGKRPQVYRDPRKLVQAMTVGPLGVTFMTREQVKQLQGVEVVQPLW